MLATLDQNLHESQVYLIQLNECGNYITSDLVAPLCSILISSITQVALFEKSSVFTIGTLKVDVDLESSVQNGVSKDSVFNGDVRV